MDMYVRVFFMKTSEKLEVLRITIDWNLDNNSNPIAHASNFL